MLSSVLRHSSIQLPTPPPSPRQSPGTLSGSAVFCCSEEGLQTKTVIREQLDLWGVGSFRSKAPEFPLGGLSLHDPMYRVSSNPKAWSQGIIVFPN